MIRRTKWFWLDSEGLFPLPCVLVLLPSASGSAAVALAFGLSRTVCLEFGLFASPRCVPESLPLSRATGGSGAATTNLRGKEASVYLQLLASRQTFLSVGKPACQRATLLCLAGQCRHSAKGRKIQQSGGWWQTSCYPLRLGLNIAIE